MSIWKRLTRWRLSHKLNEPDAPADSDTAMTRTPGGDPEHGTPTTTGTGSNEEFVGRVAGDDTSVEETGAEARAAKRADG
jgi:hypothetical protein